MFFLVSFFLLFLLFFSETWRNVLLLVYFFSFLIHIGKADNTWATEVVGPAVEMIRSFLNQDSSLVPDSDTPDTTGVNTMQRDLWTQYTCKVRTGLLPKGTVFVCSISPSRIVVYLWCLYRRVV